REDQEEREGLAADQGAGRLGQGGRRRLRAGVGAVGPDGGGAGGGAVAGGRGEGGAGGAGREGAGGARAGGGGDAGGDAREAVHARGLDLRAEVRRLPHDRGEGGRRGGAGHAQRQRCDGDVPGDRARA